MTKRPLGGYDKIIKLFYEKRNSKIHLREISRQCGLNENSTSRFLKQMEQDSLIQAEREGNLKKYYLKRNNLVFWHLAKFDLEKFNSLPLLRRQALNYFLQALEEKPIISILFGSTAKGTYHQDSDIDILLVVNKKINSQKAANTAEALTTMKVNDLQISYNDFLRELKTKEDKVVAAAVSIGYPLSNHLWYYELVSK